jgi:nucleotide-binding universal stress UspA family protein
LVNPSSSIADIAGSALTSRRVTSAIALAREQAAQALEEAKEFAAKAGARVRSYFPAWEVRAEGIAGTPSQELAQRADEWKPDLIVVGSQGRSALGRFFLGSVSKKLATESRSSVRVVRSTVERGPDAPPRIMVGVDGSPGAERAVRSVGRRVWPDGVEVRVVAVDDSVSPAKIARILPTAADIIRSSNEEVAGKTRQMAEWAAEELRAICLRVSVVTEKGDPQRLLLEEARKWDADSIFVGSRGLDQPDERAGLGGVSTALVTNATCTVEVVR